MSHSQKYHKITDSKPLSNKQYHKQLLKSLRKAQRRVWASIFIVDSRVHSDEKMIVRTILKKLKSLKKKGLDVKLIVGNSSIEELKLANNTSIKYAHSLGIPVKEFNAKRRSKTHSKYVIIDSEIIIMGSHNWSQMAFMDADEESIQIKSIGLNKNLAKEFVSDWKSS